MDRLADGYGDGRVSWSVGVGGLVSGLRLAPDFHRARSPDHQRSRNYRGGPFGRRSRRIRGGLTSESRSGNRRGSRCPGRAGDSGRGRKEADMSTSMLWVVIVGAAAVTFVLRVSFVALLGRTEMPLFVERALRFVPAAVLTAFVIPLLIYDNGAMQVSLGNERLLAGLMAALIAWRTRSVLFTLGVGMATLWILQAIGQSL